MVAAEYNSNIIDFLMPSFKLKGSTPSANKVNFWSSNGFFILIQADVVATPWISQTALWISRVFQRTLAAKSQVVIFLNSLSSSWWNISFSVEDAFAPTTLENRRAEPVEKKGNNCSASTKLEIMQFAGQHVQLFSF